MRVPLDVCALATVCAVLAVGTPAARGQEPEATGSPLRTGLSVSFGVGNLGVRDDFVSGARYSGRAILVEASWSQAYRSHALRFGLRYRLGRDVSNESLSATVMHYGLGVELLHPVARPDVWGHSTTFSVGPSLRLDGYYREQAIAATGGFPPESRLTSNLSWAFLGSLGVSARFDQPLSGTLGLETEAGAGLISFATRVWDDETDDPVRMRLLTALTGTDADAGVRLRYRGLDPLTLGLGYRFHLTRLTTWDDLISASDNFVLNLGYRF